MHYDTYCVRRNRNIFLDNAFPRSSEYCYSRYHNPNVADLSQTIECLYGNMAQCVLTSSGMSAVQVAASQCQKMLVDYNIHSEATKLLKTQCEFDYVDLKNINPSRWPKADALMFDAVSNRNCFTYNQSEICSIAHSKGLKVIVDNTMLTSYFNNPFCKGADMVIESLSKYAGGHGDALGGALLSKDAHLYDEYIAIRGINIPVFNAFLIRRGIATLPMRMEHIKQNTTELLSYLRRQEVEVLEGNAEGGVILFTLGDTKTHDDFISRLKLIENRFSFGQDNSLISAIREFPPMDAWNKMPRMRLCLGLENSDDLIGDIEQALKGVTP